MRQLLKYSGFLFLFLACKQRIDRTKFKTDDLKYSVYTWNFNTKTNKMNFYLADYLHIDAKGSFQLFRHPFQEDKPEYFNGITNDKWRFDIDSILVENKYFPEIKPGNNLNTPSIIYDGFTYLLDYKLKGKEQTKIVYINSNLRTPENILWLTSYLDKIISSTKHIKCDSFSIGKYLDTLIKINSFNLPPPPMRTITKLEPPQLKQTNTLTKKFGN